MGKSQFHLMNKRQKSLYPIYEESNFIQQEFNNDENLSDTELPETLIIDNVRIGTSVMDQLPQN